MTSTRDKHHISRRDLLRGSAILAAGAFLPAISRNSVAWAAGYGQQSAAATTEATTAIRAMLAGIPLESQKLADNLTMLSGPGGTVAVLHGSDGKLVVDTFVAPAWSKFNDALGAIDKQPVKHVIDTHWHYDHTDNNGPLHQAGATIIAHENTKTRMSETHDLAVLNLRIVPSPPEALPQVTFKGAHSLQLNGETLHLQHLPSAHTDTDIYVHFEKADVLHAGDCYFGGIFPFIDAGTGGSISGMITAADKILARAGSKTRIIAGHGPIGQKADVEKFRDMLVTSRDRVQKLKSSGKSLQEAVAAKPLADLDPLWGKGFFNAGQFTEIAYLAL